MSKHALPYDEDAEIQVLGSCLLYPESLDQAQAELAADDFHVERHRIIWQTILTLRRGGRPVDLVSMTAELRSTENLDKAGGTLYLTDLWDAVATSATLGYYLGRVRGLSVRRRLVSALGGVIDRCCTSADETDTLLASAYGAIEQATSAAGAGKDILLTLSDMADIYTRYVTDLAKNRFSTGFENLDAVIGGVAPGEVLIITAYSALFKSALLQNILMSGCRQSGLHHLFFSMEMPATRVFERTVQIGLGHYTYNIVSEFHHHAEERRAQTMLELAGIEATKLVVCERSGLTIEQIEHYTRLARCRFGAIGAIGLDYLGLMTADNTRTEYERISHVAEQSKSLAKRLKIPVILLAQVNRSSVTAGEIEMTSAKGSGAIEASADYLLGLQKDRNGDIILKVLKNRNGESGAQFVCDIKKDFLQFRDLVPSNTSAKTDTNRGLQRQRKSIAPASEEYAYE